MEKISCIAIYIVAKFPEQEQELAIEAQNQYLLTANPFMKRKIFPRKHLFHYPILSTAFCKPDIRKN